MDYSAANTGLWNFFIQLGIIAGILLLSNVLVRKSKLIRNSLIPTSVLAGFLLLILKSLNILRIPDDFLNMVTYHGIAIGFIALSLRVTNNRENKSDKGAGFRSGAVIISTYLMQAVVGLAISLLLCYLWMPGLFKAAGILLPMAYGQGPGQANNVGSTYEALGFIGGQSYGLSLAAAGYLSACVVGVLYLNILSRKGKLQRREGTMQSGSVTVDAFQDKGEVPLSESVDRLSIQVALVMLVYLATYLVTWGLTSLTARVAPGVDKTLSPLLWGFNFIIGSMLAMLVKAILNWLRKSRVMTRQYQNNYLLSRISGMAFDLMIVSGIAAIDFKDLSGLWVPFVVTAVSGAITTFYYLRWLCDRVYPGYEKEGFLSMYGMLTGTISSGILLLRPIDPDFKTPAANNLVTGSSYGIVLGSPMLIFIGLAAESDTMLYVTIGLIFVYLAGLLWLLLRKQKTGGKAPKTAKG
jgi:glutamate:Na+ symporter, ESS family